MTEDGVAASGRPSRALQLGRRLLPWTILFAVLLAVPLAIAGQWVAALIFGIAPLAWLGWVTAYVYRVEQRSRALSGDLGGAARRFRGSAVQEQPGGAESDGVGP